jgi:hypothetical protein
MNKFGKNSKEVAAFRAAHRTDGDIQKLFDTAISLSDFLRSTESGKKAVDAAKLEALKLMEKKPQHNYAKQWLRFIIMLPLTVTLLGVAPFCKWCYLPAVALLTAILTMISFVVVRKVLLITP